MTDWSSTRLRADHELKDFDSGQPTLDQWLREHALRADGQGTARTWVWTKPGSNVVDAYFSIAPTQVARDVLTPSQAGGVAVVPGYLLARLALNRSLQGKRVGGLVLYNALELIVTGSDQTGGRLIVVDAIDARAERFYAKFDFKPAREPQSEEGSSEPKLTAYPRRMVVKIASVRRALDL